MKDNQHFYQRWYSFETPDAQHEVELEEMEMEDIGGTPSGEWSQCIPMVNTIKSEKPE